MKEYNFYNGFEGEPELQIISIDKFGNKESLIRFWIGYFDTIMKNIAPETDGCWAGVPLHYHLVTGWHDDSLWKCEYIDLFILQLESINQGDLDNETKSVLAILKIELNTCLTMGNDVYFKYF